MKTKLLTTIMSAVISVSANATSVYEQQYQDQMGTEAPAVKNLTEATQTAEKGSVYANRNMSEFGIVNYNWEPSPTPHKFEETVSPLSKQAMSHIEATNTDGYIVIKDNTIIHEYYAKGMHPTTKHAAHSTGKSWSSAIWGDVLLSAMDKKVKEMLPELSESVFANENIRAVVDMRVPVFWYEDYNDKNSPVVKSFSAVGLDYRDQNFDTLDFLKGLERHPELESGDWIYSSANTSLIGLLGPKLTKQHAYEDTRQFYHQLGLEHISGSVANLHGQYDTGGGQYFTLRDFVKLPNAMANGGKVSGRQVISSAYIQDVFNPQADKIAAWANGKYAKLMPMFKFYSNQWYVVNDHIAFAIGSYGQYLAFNMKTNVAIAKFSTYPTGQNKDFGAKDLVWLLEQVQSY